MSFGTSVTPGLSKSNRASSPACFNALATAGVEPDAEIGSRSATFTVPVEPVVSPASGPARPPPDVPQAASSAATSALATTSLKAPHD